MTKTDEEAWIERALAALNGQGRRSLIEFLQRRRWFSGKGKPLADVRLFDAIDLSEGADLRMLVFLMVEYRGGATERYVTPLTVKSMTESGDTKALVELPGSAAHEWVCDGAGDADTWIRLYEAVAKGQELAGKFGCLTGRGMPQEWEELAKPAREAKVLSAEQSNTSVILDRRVMMKLIRKVDAGINPDSEVLEFLTTHTTCRDVPALLGVVTYDDGITDEVQPVTVAVLQRFVPNVGDGWNYTLAHLAALLGEGGKAIIERGDTYANAVAEMSGPFLAQIQRLGEITGGLHMALASRRDQEAFCPEPISPSDVERWQADMAKHLTEVCYDLQRLQPEQRVALSLMADDVARLETACRNRFNDLDLLAQGMVVKIRHHGDFHLGQVLKTTDSFVVIDFEGEPTRPIEERRAKVCPLKDVGGMLRSFNYAAQATLKGRKVVSSTDVGLMTEWERATRVSFLDGYGSVAKPGEAAFLPRTWDEARRVIQVYELDKALYEVRYEMWNRPDWLSIPLVGIRALVP